MKRNKKLFKMKSSKNHKKSRKDIMKNKNIKKVRHAKNLCGAA